MHRPRDQQRKPKRTANGDGGWAAAGEIRCTCHTWQAGTSSPQASDGSVSCFLRGAGSASYYLLLGGLSIHIHIVADEEVVGKKMPNHLLTKVEAHSTPYFEGGLDKAHNHLQKAWADPCLVVMGTDFATRRASPNSTSAVPAPRPCLKRTCRRDLGTWSCLDFTV